MVMDHLWNFTTGVPDWDRSRVQRKPCFLVHAVADFAIWEHIQRLDVHKIVGGGGKGVIHHVLLRQCSLEDARV